MRVISVSVCGDNWLNPEQVKVQLYASDPSDIIVLDLNSEGVSLAAVGITRVLMEFCRHQSRDPTTIYLQAWSNPAECIPFQRVDTVRASHFFWMSERYKPRDLVRCDHNYTIGFFMGRRTLSRCRIMYDMANMCDSRILLSLMRGGMNPVQSLSDADHDQEWLDNIDIDTYHQWWHHPPIGSIDDHSIRDQYDRSHNTNRDLLEHYHKFQVELVAETYCRGQTFFPTEKTVRPLAAGRPCLIYGPRHFLQGLREFGFETWNDYWSEAYDDFEGPERWNMMRDVIKQLLAMPMVDLQAQFQAMHTKLQNNRLNLERVIEEYRPS